MNANSEKVSYVIPTERSDEESSISARRINFLHPSLRVTRAIHALVLRAIFRMFQCFPEERVGMTKEGFDMTRMDHGAIATMFVRTTKKLLPETIIEGIEQC